jgi:hypothetical protein
MLKLEAYICKIIREFTCWGHICANFTYVCVDPCIHNYVNVSYIMCAGYVWMGVLAEVSKVRYYQATATTFQCWMVILF